MAVVGLIDCGRMVHHVRSPQHTRPVLEPVDPVVHEVACDEDGNPHERVSHVQRPQPMVRVDPRTQADEQCLSHDRLGDQERDR
jgi:hypothetical protein